MAIKFIEKGSRMTDAKRIHNIDQTMTLWREILEQAPLTLFKFFSELKEKGFNDQQALFLTAEALKKMLYPGG